MALKSIFTLSFAYHELLHYLCLLISHSLDVKVEIWQEICFWLLLLVFYNNFFVSHEAFLS
jgi:hypothetical protein